MRNHILIILNSFLGDIEIPLIFSLNSLSIVPVAHFKRRVFHSFIISFENTLKEIWYGDKYNKLREQHRTGDYPDFCKSCDFLVDDPEVLVYTNHERENHKMYGTKFSLEDYR